MNKEQDYASDSDESDEDFRPEDLAGESPVSEDDAEESEENDGGMDEHTEEVKKKLVKRKTSNKKVSRKKVISRQNSESDDENTNTSRRATRQINDSQTNGKGKSLEKDELLSDEEDKSRTNALWADFLKEVKPSESLSNTKTSNAENKPSSSVSNGKSSSKNSKSQESTVIPIAKAETKRVITEVLEFAGEEVSIQREIDSSIKENQAASIPASKKQPFSRIMPGVGIKRTIPTAASGSGSGAGLGSVLNQLGKKKKLSVLEKTQLDWKSFKQSEGIDEQLQTFNKGKDGYLERQDFLQRTDLRQFEIEKNLRLSNRRPF